MNNGNEAAVHGNPMQAPLQGLQLIEASAGTGKTYTISGLFLRLLLEKKLPVEKILVVTFTKAATEELRDRIRQRVVDALLAFAGEPTNDELLLELLANSENHAADLDWLRVAVFSFDQVPILTIHAFSQRVLQDHAFGAAVPFSCELLEDETELHQQIVDDYWRTLLPELPAAVLATLLANGGPGALAKGLRGWVERPVLNIQPALRPNAEGTLLWQEALQTFASEWSSESAAAAKEYLLNHPDLSRSKVRVATIAPVMVAVDQLLENIGSGEVLPEKFNYLGAEYLTADKAVKKGKTVREFPLYAAVDELSLAAEQYEQWLTLWVNSLRVELLERLRQELPRLKQQARVRGYSDFLRELNEALKTDGANELIANVRRKFSAALIDEFQDTDELQFDNFQRLFVSSAATIDSISDASSEYSEGNGFAAAADIPVFLVGDPKQAIYAFRGADIYAYLNARKVADRHYNLATNWRSEPALITATNALFERREQPFVLEEIQYIPVAAAELERPPLTLPPELEGAALTINWLPKDKKPRSAASAVRYSLRHCAESITELLIAASEGTAMIGNTAISGGDIAVLVRSNAEGSQLQAELRERGVNSIRTDQASVWNTEEADAILRLLLAMAEPQRFDGVRAMLASPLFGLTSSDLVALSEASGEADWDSWLRSLREWRLLWREHGLARCWQALSADRDVTARLLSQIGGARKLTNANHIIELLTAEAQQQQWDSATLLQWMQQQMANAGSNGSDSALLRLDSDENLVKIVTIHKSKGLEYPLVFCPTLFANVKDPLAKTSNDWLCWHDEEGGAKLGFASTVSDSVLACWQKEQLAEDMRLLYVALTRAVYRCFLYWGEVNSTPENNALAWLLHGNDETIGDPAGLLSLSAEHPGSLAVIELADPPTSGFLGEEGSAQNDGESAGESVFGRTAVSALPRMLPPSTGKHSELTARVAERHIRQSWRMTSFTGISAALERFGSSPSAGLAANVSSGLSANLQASLPPSAGYVSDAIESADYDQHNAASVLVNPTVESELEPAGIHAFPRGARAGVCLHDVLEHLNFADSNEEHIAKQVEASLQRYGYAAELWQEAVTGNIQDVLNTPLRAAGRALSELAPAAWLPEMEFHFPLQGLTGAKIFSVLEQHNFGAGKAIETRLSQSLSQRSFPAIDGFMKGFIDLIFEADGRYYVADYKSNWLGGDASAYHQEALDIAIAKADYFLQYLIYTVALHRYLKMRIRGYSYDSHVGGVYYLFLRGMTGNNNQRGPHESGGVYFDRPSKALIEDLDQLFTPLPVT